VHRQLVGLDAGGQLDDIYRAARPELRRYDLGGFLASEVAVEHQEHLVEPTEQSAFLWFVKYGAHLHPLLAENDRAAERFKTEIRLALDITHKNVCRTYGWQRMNGALVISMEFVEGETLRAILDRVKGVSVPQGLLWATEICDALASAHEHRIVHRDLKPENIMVDLEGHIKVMDFGIARSLDVTGDSLEDSPGTPSYMSPEQRNRGPVGPTSNIYSLGLVLYELFTGVRREPGSAIPPSVVNRYLPARVTGVSVSFLAPNRCHTKR